MKDLTRYITIYGAREHNLKNITVKIPHRSLTVITGVSGSGKSSLAFDTIHAEGQRRYLETFSAYARNFLETIQRPDVDLIEGLSPVIAIEQKTTSKNPRSTVGTITEIYDFLRLLYARIGEAYSYETNEKMVRFSEEQIETAILKNFNQKKILILAPQIKGRKGHYRELFNKILANGYYKVRIDGTITELTKNHQIDRYKTHFIEIVIDTITINSKNISRLKNALRSAFQQSKDVIQILDTETDKISFFSKQLMCPTTGLAYDEPAPHSFSFNSPQGACPHCKGLGVVSEISIDKIIPDKSLSIREGAILPLGKYKNSLIFWQLEAIGKKHHFDLDTPIKKISQEALKIILYGSNEQYHIEHSPLGYEANFFLSFEGIINYVENFGDSSSLSSKQSKWIAHFYSKKQCPVCHGKRLKKESLHFKIDQKSIADISEMELSKLAQWIQQLPEKLSHTQKTIATEILIEIDKRLQFLLNVGLEYLSLNRPTGSLSGGEAQRIRLATQIGSQLINTLYILDEPSIGLHQRDNIRLINSLKALRDSGNTVIVVEHDKEIMLQSDYIVDIGPGAGKHGGEILAMSETDKFLHSNTLTARYLSGKENIDFQQNPRKGNKLYLTLKGASGHNLKNISVSFPLGMFICITGVSGSGKSSLINETLLPILKNAYHHAKQQPLPYKAIEGIENLSEVIAVNQAPIGRSPRSNPATYTGIFTDIRNLFASTPEAKVKGFKSNRFSFNVKGGRCETCKGSGVKTIEMNFLPDVFVTCPDCNGNRYNQETLSIRYKGKNINDILNMTVNQAVEFFENIPSIYKKIKTLQDVGLGYITLGQSSISLSGGESQRIKLASELSKRSTGKTLYILDEPTTGLHFNDIKILLIVINQLIEKGNTVIIIEHNMDIIKNADYIIDMGPEGGEKGGQIIAQGTINELIQYTNDSYTAHYLKKEIHQA